jgi:hypothetical protein
VSTIHANRHSAHCCLLVFSCCCLPDAVTLSPPPAPGCSVVNACAEYVVWRVAQQPGRKGLDANLAVTQYLLVPTILLFVMCCQQQRVSGGEQCNSLTGNS